MLSYIFQYISVQWWMIPYILQEMGELLPVNFCFLTPLHLIRELWTPPFRKSSHPNIRARNKERQADLYQARHCQRIPWVVVLGGQLVCHGCNILRAVLVTTKVVNGTQASSCRHTWHSTSDKGWATRLSSTIRAIFPVRLIFSYGGPRQRSWWYKR